MAWACLAWGLHCGRADQRGAWARQQEVVRSVFGRDVKAMKVARYGVAGMLLAARQRHGRAAGDVHRACTSALDYLEQPQPISAGGMPFPACRQGACTAAHCGSNHVVHAPRAHQGHCPAVVPWLGWMPCENSWPGALLCCGQGLPFCGALVRGATVLCSS